MKRATIEDIAQLLSISASTVSRALKDHPDISSETKQKVIEAARQLKYLPNRFAINLKKQEFRIIGVIVPEITHFFFSSVIKGIEEFCYKNNYSVLLAISNENLEIEKKNIKLLLESGAAGILMSRTKESKDIAHISEIINYNIPIVFFDRFFKELKADKVIINDEYAAYLAVEHLIKTGCRKIVMFKVPEDIEISKRRKIGYIEALRSNNIPFNPNLIINCDNYKSALKETQKLIDQKISFDAIFAVNDNTAVGALEILKQNNIEIPNQVSIVGFGNDFISEIVSPKLTTIEQNGYEMGFVATQLLLDKIANDIVAKPRTEVVPIKLILRDSTKKIEQ